MLDKRLLSCWGVLSIVGGIGRGLLWRVLLVGPILLVLPILLVFVPWGLVVSLSGRGQVVSLSGRRQVGVAVNDLALCHVTVTVLVSQLTVLLDPLSGLQVVQGLLEIFS